MPDSKVIGLKSSIVPAANTHTTSPSDLLNMFSNKLMASLR